MSLKEEVKYDKNGRVRNVKMTATNSVGSTSATYAFNQKGQPQLQKASQKLK